MAYIGIEIIDTHKFLCAYDGAALHLTLAHFEKPPANKAVLLASFLSAMARVPSPSLFLEGFDTWETAGDVILLRPDRPALTWMRTTILAQLEQLEIKASHDYHDWKPHITVGRYGSVQDYTLEKNSLLLIGEALEFCGGPQITRYRFPFMRFNTPTDEAPE